MSAVKARFFLWPLAAYLCWILVTSAGPKLAEPLEFASQLAGYTFFPAWMITALVVLIPWIEVVLGVALVLRPDDRSIAASVLLLLIAFTGVVLLAVLMGIDTACGCGAGCGVDPGERTGWPKIGKNLTRYVLPAALILILQRFSKGEHPSP